MRILSPLPRKRGRLEIIPLIDIMFFLLASFMMVSLTMQHLITIKVSLPTATQAKSVAKPDMASITVLRGGQVLLDDRPVSFPQLRVELRKKIAAHPDYPVYISGEKDTTHASMIYVLDLVKRVGVQRVAFAVSVAQPPSEGSP